MFRQLFLGIPDQKDQYKNGDEDRAQSDHFGCTFISAERADEVVPHTLWDELQAVKGRDS